MFRILCLAVFLSCCTTVACAEPSPHYALRSRIALPEDSGWDYLTFDQAQRHLFVTRGDHVDVVDVEHASQIGRIDGVNGAHGVALVPASKRGYASAGKSNMVIVFGSDDFKTIAHIALSGRGPDAIVFDPASGHVLAFNGKSHDVSVIDPVMNKEIALIALPGKPEFAVSDDAGHVFVNLEDRNALSRLDTHANRIEADYALPGCESPSGLAIDIAHRRLFSVCDNGVMAVTDGGSGRHVASVAIGNGPDAVAYDPAAALIFSSNGESGTLTVIHQDSADHYRVLQNVPTQRSARTLAVDDARAAVYLSAAKVKDVPGGGRPMAEPGSFEVLVVAAH